MPYFIYKITPVSASLVKNLEKLAEFEVFKEAKEYTRRERQRIEANDGSSVKVIFEKNMLEAEEQLLEKRDAPI